MIGGSNNSNRKNGRVKTSSKVPIRVVNTDDWDVATHRRSGRGAALRPRDGVVGQGPSIVARSSASHPRAAVTIWLGWPCRRAWSLESRSWSLCPKSRYSAHGQSRQRQGHGAGEKFRDSVNQNAAWGMSSEFKLSGKYSVSLGAFVVFRICCNSNPTSTPSSSRHHLCSLRKMPHIVQQHFNLLHFFASLMRPGGLGAPGMGLLRGPCQRDEGRLRELHKCATEQACRVHGQVFGRTGTQRALCSMPLMLWTF